jgi:trk system potassium uptake protein TrkH
MNYQVIRNIIGYIMLVEAFFMLPALLISLFHGESGAVVGFSVAIVLLLAIGMPMAMFRSKRRGLYAREGFVIVGLSWITVSVFGSLPFYISGAIPGYINCFFETVSGFTTTGASILTNIEALPMGLLYWRSFTHWLGGMGVLVFLLAIAPVAKDSGEALHLLRAESPGVNVGKLVPRIRRSALILYEIYIALSILETVLLLIGKLPFFDSLTITMATAGTGGFAIKNDSIASYSFYAKTVITVFMLLYGMNFNLFYLLLLRKFRRVFGNGELRTYLGTAVIAILIISYNITPLYGSFGKALHNASFTVASIMSTTGFVIADYQVWPQLSRSLLLLLMFMGACAGSTGGGAKSVRILILIKSVRRSIHQGLHPRAVRLVHMDGEVVEDGTVDAVNNFMLIYFLQIGRAHV